jgi:hypothetical protein
MTLFEYISIATSLMLSFSLARTLTNLAPVFATMNDHETMMETVRGLTQQQG